MTKTHCSGGSRKTKRNRRDMRGGVGNSPSAWSSVLGQVGTENDQYNNTFVRGGQFGNALQNMAGTQPSVVQGGFPSAANLSLIQRAGKRKTRSKKGGYWGNVVSQALVPFSLWFAQNRFGKTQRNKGERTRKYRR
jgi:hypothetical protein